MRVAFVLRSAEVQPLFKDLWTDMPSGVTPSDSAPCIEVPFRNPPNQPQSQTHPQLRPSPGLLGRGTPARKGLRWNPLPPIPPLDRGEIEGTVLSSESSPFLGEDLEFFFL